MRVRKCIFKLVKLILMHFFLVFGFLNENTAKNQPYLTATQETNQNHLTMT